MKRIIVVGLVLAAFLTFYSCGSGGDKKTSKPGADDVTKNPDYQKGFDLVWASNCKTCHTVSDPLTGPPYKEVAVKYAGADASAVEGLADKIINGGGGVWGQIPMTPHPEISKDDAKAMVKYILLLK